MTIGIVLLAVQIEALFFSPLPRQVRVLITFRQVSANAGFFSDVDSDRAEYKWGVVAVELAFGNAGQTQARELDLEW